MSVTLKSTSKLLFIGDSITDVGRRECKESIGTGYVRMLRDWLCAQNPQNAPKVLNFGISGNKINDLAKRWQRDVIDQSPDVLSIYIGVNDVWHGLIPGRDGTDLNIYVAKYRELIDLARAANPQLQLVLCEPSVLWLSEPADADERIRPYVSAVHDLARDCGADAIVPLHQAFTRARQERPDIAWTTDGVHPTSTGHMLIARSWLTACGLV